VESFICNQIKVFYREQEFYDFINITPYSLFTYFPLKCRIQRWADDSIRIMFMGAVGGNKMDGLQWDSRQIMGTDFDIWDPIY
jgi:hypothetical protein